MKFNKCAIMCAVVMAVFVSAKAGSGRQFKSVAECEVIRSDSVAAVCKERVAVDSVFEYQGPVIRTERQSLNTIASATKAMAVISVTWSVAYVVTFVILAVTAD